VRAALVALDEDKPDAPALVSAAKARASDTFVLASAEAVQMHGGIGVTDELDIGFYYKRARVAELTFGSAAYHRERYARLNGY
jgi:alkylation response protein AidB-like acyl-CoA dehydrogenase